MFNRSIINFKYNLDRKGFLTSVPIKLSSMDYPKFHGPADRKSSFLLRNSFIKGITSTILSNKIVVFDSEDTSIINRFYSNSFIDNYIRGRM